MAVSAHKAQGRRDRGDVRRVPGEDQNHGDDGDDDDDDCLQNDFPGGLTLEQFTNLFPDLNNGMATANLVFRVLDEDNSEKLGFKEFLQAIDLVGARWVRCLARSGPWPRAPAS